MNLLKNNLANPLLDIKTTVIAKITTGGPAADKNVILSLATETRSKFENQKSTISSIFSKSIWKKLPNFF